MILLGKRQLKSAKALKERRAYVKSLLDERRPNVSPSSEEWVSGEHYQGHRSLLLEEISEINKALRRL